MSETRPAERAATLTPGETGTVRLWRTATAALAPVAPLALGAAALIAPYSYAATDSAILATAATESGRMQASVWCSWLYAMTIIPATIAVVAAARPHLSRLAAIGGLLSILGFAASIMLPSTELLAIGAARGNVDTGAALALNEAVWEQPAVVLTLLLFLAGVTVGAVLLAIAFWRSRTVPRWAAIALGLSAVLRLSPVGPPNVATALSCLSLTIAYAAVAAVLLRGIGDTAASQPG
jgi:hypothetical protein